MARFSDLPNELVIDIWGYLLEPENVESFALVSKSIYGLSTPFVKEDTRLRHQFSKVRLSHETEDTKPTELLEQMLLNPRIPLYMNELDLEQWACSRDEHLGPRVSSFEDTMAVFRTAIRSSSFVAPSEEVHWIRDIELGDEDPILALIVMRLTNMRKLRFCDYSLGEDCYLLQALEHIMRSSDVSIHSGVSINGSESDGSNQLISPKPPTLSNLSDLELGASCITLDVLSQLLRSIKELKSFSYIKDHDHALEIFQIHAALFEYSRRSLQKLCLHDHYGCRSPMGDITHFQKLSELETDLVLLLRVKGGPLRHLADVLPTSIERVTIHTRYNVAFETVREMVLLMVKSKMKRLPNLKALTLGGPALWGEYCAEDTAELQKGCAEVGVRFEIYECSAAADNIHFFARDAFV